jgi:hypothetical protein
LLGTLVPVYFALALAFLIGRKISSEVSMRYFAATGLGILLFFFVDVTLDSTELGVNSGFSGGVVQIMLLSSFALGAVVLTLADYYFHSTLDFTDSTANPAISSLFFVPALMALGLGIHGAGEGSSFAYVAAFTGSTSLIDAFGGYGPVISYVLHKFLEATIIGTAYSFYVIFGAAKSSSVKVSPQSVAFSRRRFVEIVVLGALVWTPTLLGTTVGYFISVNPIYFYAFASGATIYSVLRLASPSLGSILTNRRSFLTRENVFAVLFILLGFFLLYFAALLHSTVIF